MVEAPCRDCEDRVLYCHSSCERYKEYKERNEIVREKKRLDSLTFSEPLRERRKKLSKRCALYGMKYK